MTTIYGNPGRAESTHGETERKKSDSGPLGVGECGGGAGGNKTVFISRLT